MPYLSSTQLPETLVFLLLPGKSPFGAIKITKLIYESKKPKTITTIQLELTPL